MTQRRGLPDRPRLRHGVDAFPAGDGLIVRTVIGAVQVPQSYRGVVEHLLPRLDGHYSYEQLLGGQAAGDGIYALGLLSWLAQQGALADGPPADALPTTRTPPRLEGIEIDLLDNGCFATALRTRLTGLGAAVTVSSAASAGRLALACPDGPALASLEARNLQSRRSSFSWMAAFPFGDGVVTTPVFIGGTAPCFRCFELRWLGISPSVAFELAYFDRARLAPSQLITKENADALAASVVPLIAAGLTSAPPSTRVMLLRADSGELFESPLEPCPHCDVCGESSRGVAVPEPATSWNDPAMELDRIGRSLDELTGLPCGLAVLWTRDEQWHASAAPMHVVVARFGLPEPEDVSGAQENWAHGTADTAETARAIALVEAFERYGGLSPPPPGVWRAFSQLGGDALRPTELPLFSASEYSRPAFPFQPFDPDREARWNWAFNLTRRRRVLVPTSAVWYGYDDWLLGESSNGVAAHTSRGLALRNAALELIERDAFMIHWLHRLSPPRLDPRRLQDERCARLINWIERSGYVVHLMDLTTNLRVPVVLAAGVHEDGRRPALLLGAGAALSPYDALHKAVSELYSATFSAPERWTLPPAVDDAAIARLGDHARAYEHPDWLCRASFLWAAQRCVEWPAGRDGHATDELGTMTELLREHGHDLLGIDMTGPDVARHGLHIVRAIVPGLQPLALGNRARLGGKRLFEAPREMGYADAAERAEDLNPIPHCFP